MFKVIAFLVASLFAAAYANATSYWSTASTVSTLNVHAPQNCGGTFTCSNWVTMTGVSSLGSCGTTSIGGTTYVQFALTGVSISAYVYSNTISLIYGPGPLFAELFAAKVDGGSLSLHVDDSILDHAGNCIVQDVQ